MKRAPLTGGQSHPVEETNGTPAIAGGEPIRTRDRRLIFGAPVIGEAEIASVTECLRSNWIGLGGRVERFEQEFARYKGAPYAARGKQWYGCHSSRVACAWNRGWR